MTARVAALAAAALVLGACSRDVGHEEVADLALAAERILSPIEASTDTRALIGRAREALWRLDVAALHDALPDSARADGARAVLLDARQAGPRRVVGWEARPAVFERRPLHAPGPAPGDGWLLASVLPLPDRRYRVSVSSAVRTGRADPFDLWCAVPEGLRQLERDLRERSGEERSIDVAIESLRRPFPGTTSFVLRYLDPGGRVSWSAGENRLALEPRLRVRIERLGEDYPLLARYASRLDRTVRGAGTVRRDGVLARWRNDGLEEGVSLSFAARDGRLIPLTDGTAPVDLCSSLELSFLASASFEVYGVRSAVGGVRGSFRIDPRGEAPELDFDVSGAPASLVLEGRLFGVMPLDLVDFLFFGSLESAARQMLETILLGRDGEGLELTLQGRDEPNVGHYAGSTLLLDVPSGRLARIGIRLFATSVRPDAPERRELLRFGRDLVERLRNDLERPATLTSFPRPIRSGGSRRATPSIGHSGESRNPEAPGPRLSPG